MEDAPRPWVLVAVNFRKSGHHLGELYTLITKLLLNPASGYGRWALKDHAAPPFDVCLGESVARGIPFKALASSALSRMDPPLVNFYNFFKQLTWKVEMVETLRRYCRANRIDVNTVIPESYVFRCGKTAVNARERRALIDSYMEEASSKRMRNVWILKPSGGGKGKGIEVMDDITSILSVVDSAPFGPTDWVVSRYIEDPLLLRGKRKFDIRLWVLVDHNYHIYLYRQGVLRTGSVAYTLDNLMDPYVHMSNHCIQETHPDYGKFEPTNEMWWHEFDVYVRSAFPAARVSFVDDILPQLRQHVVMSLEAARPALWNEMGGGSGRYGHRSFNLFGFDFMIDAAFKVWLIEINSSPGVANQLLQPLANDLIATAISPVCPPQRRGTKGAAMRREDSAPCRSASLSASSRREVLAVRSSVPVASPSSASYWTRRSSSDDVPGSVATRVASERVIGARAGAGAAVTDDGTPEPRRRPSSGGGAYTRPDTNPAGSPCCGRECCLWGFERIDDMYADMLAQAQAGVGVGVRRSAGVGVGAKVNVRSSPEGRRPVAAAAAAAAAERSRDTPERSSEDAARHGDARAPRSGVERPPRPHAAVCRDDELPGIRGGVDDGIRTPHRRW